MIGNLHQQQIGSQLNVGAFTALVLSLVGGSFAAGMAIINTGERVTLVKHQQL